MLINNSKSKNKRHRGKQKTKQAKYTAGAGDDIKYQRSDPLAVVVVLHDLSLASAYADRMALVSSGRLEAIGTPLEVLTEERVERVYGLPVELHVVAGRPVVVPTR